MPTSSRPRLTAARARTRLIAAALLLAAATMPSGAAAPGANPESRNEVLVRQAFENWADGSGTVFDLLSPDVRWTIHGSGPIARTYVGVEDFLERAAAPLTRRLATPVMPELHHVWAVDDRVIIRFDATATTKAGARYRNQYVWIFRMEEGAVVEAEAFLDLVAYQDVLDANAPDAP